MNKNFRFTASRLLCCTAALLFLSACAVSPAQNAAPSGTAAQTSAISTTAKTQPVSATTQAPVQESLYDYAGLYALRDAAFHDDEIRALAAFLRSKDVLAVKEAAYDSDRGILRIDYQLRLTEKDPLYTVDFTKQMQDAALLFAVFADLEGVEFNYRQADYGFGFVPILREQAEALFGEPLAPYGESEAAFTQKFPPKLEPLVWERGGMDVIRYAHVMGLD